MPEKNKHSGKERDRTMTNKISEDFYDSFKVKKDKKIRRKERRQNKNIKNWHIEEIEDSYDFNVIYEEEDEKVDKY